MARSNEAAAEALTEFADLIAIMGGDSYRIRAYEKAARSVAGFAHDLDRLDVKGLQAIPAIGKALAEKLVEFRETGSIHELDELRAQVPAGLRALLGIPGLGPKKARQVYDQLGISSLGELLDALAAQGLRDLPGWGAKTEENLTRSIRQMQEAGGRIPLGAALSQAEEMVAALEGVAGVRRITYAGSLRRMQDTIGDIDLLVASTDTEPVMAAFTSLRTVDHVLAQGSTKSSVVTAKGIQVDLRVVSPDVWGAALLYFTGSKAHNVRIREMAVRAGLKLSEYGLFHADDETLVAAETEEDVYEHLGLPWIPPTLREDRGEVEAALAGSLPDLVDIGHIKGDLHMHTDLTDGLASLEDMVAAAKAHGYRYCAITDHAPLLTMQRMTPEKALEQRARLAKLQEHAGLALLHGSELNIQEDGSLDWPDEFLAGFDVLVASIHSHFRLSKAAMTKRIIRAMENPYVNVIGHPTTRNLTKRPPVEFDTEEVFKAAARTGTALEINSFPDRLDLSDQMARTAREYGALFAIDTDSHSVVHLDNLRFGVATAQRGWVEHKQVVNTWSLRDLRRFVERKRSRATT